MAATLTLLPAVGHLGFDRTWIFKLAQSLESHNVSGCKISRHWDNARLSSW